VPFDRTNTTDEERPSNSPEQRETGDDQKRLGKLSVTVH
jgi:hypothetical protein